MSHTLLMVETSGIQDYVFGSNNLRVNIGGSALVRAVTESWIPDLLPNLKVAEGEVSDVVMEDDGRPVEAIYLGGGNALLLFGPTMEPAAFVRGLTRRLLIEAPGLRAVVAQLSFDWTKGVLSQAVKQVRTLLAQRKQQAAPLFMQPGLAVTTICAFTGEPAVESFKFGPNDISLISRSVQARLSFVKQANERLQRLLDDEPVEPALRFVRNFDDFGTLGESSYVAIVHADGNRMGERIEALSQPYTTPEQNRAYLNALRAFSRSAHRAADNALRATIRHLLDHRQGEEGKERYWQQTTDSAAVRQRLPKVTQRSNGKPQKSDGYRTFLPFRPLLFGGDDVTFVCDGRLGLALAQRYLEVYGQQKLSDGEPAVGRAGVAIVKSHYPFAQGYNLAEALATSAKKATEQGQRAALDWHFGVNGVVARLKAMRETSYSVAAGSLHSRPLPLTDPHNWQQWSTFEKLVKKFQTDRAWSGRRNKLKALEGALRGGSEAVAAFVINYDLQTLPDPDGLFSEHPAILQEGWYNKTCVYFDALEALDFFIPLSDTHGGQHDQ